MKLRALAVLLLLANLGFFAWTQGWLDGEGIADDAVSAVEARVLWARYGL